MENDNNKIKETDNLNKDESSFKYILEVIKRLAFLFVFCIGGMFLFIIVGGLIIFGVCFLSFI